ncbi:hypothetical protein RPB_3479 [Rhodopseudomonas palustris HaA2]|uniref:Uncharacterized protein n=1 Tax=Rhodopseudomonas palustris (strain HaA2) TaxID=316058 RepID=Q2IUD6_RHOP2|nr:hypothetical protein [Rhodopseudomonas palustris]ABD08174.1 hypothetical protein RPB_3479 [Rhodopseudomonas palustris HaA2]
MVEKITKTLCPGHVIYLDCDISDIRIRNSFKHRYWPDKEYNRLLEALAEVYGPVKKSEICTRGRSCEDVAREIARIVFLEEYNEVDILNELASYSKDAT